MEIVRLVLLFVHLAAFAGLLGTMLAQLNATERPVSPTTLWSARIAFLAGLLLVGVLEATDGVDVDHPKVGVKLVVGLAIVGLLESQAKKGSLKQGLYYAVVGLTFVNLGVALFWSPAHGAY